MPTAETARLPARTSPRADMRHGVCFFSVVRYVPDPVRDEARNIGVLVVSPDDSFAGSRFNLAKLHLPAGSDRKHFLDKVVESYMRRLPTSRVKDAALARREFLDELHFDATNVIQFTEPSVALGDPRQVLEEVYRERVAERTGGGGPALSRSHVLDEMTRAFRAAGVSPEMLLTRPWVPVGHDNFVFDLAVKNGTWVGVVQVLSFRKQDTLRVEHEGAWFARVLPLVRHEYGTDGRVIVEAGSAGGESGRREDRVRAWVEDAGATVHSPEDIASMATSLSAAASKRSPSMSL